MLAEKLDIYVTTERLCELLVKYQIGHKPKGDVSRPVMPKYVRPAMPKYVRHGLMNDCVMLSFRTLDYIYAANRDMANRARAYQLVLDNLKAIEYRIRVMGNVGFLSYKQTANIMTAIANCAKQATALRNASQSRKTI